MEEPIKNAEMPASQEACLGKNSRPMFPKNISLAMAYVPLQTFQKLYEPDVGFCRGTFFQELDLPFIGEEAVK